MYIYTYIHTYIHAYVHTYMHTYVHIYIHTFTVCMHACMLCMYAMSTYIHTYIHTTACIPKIAYNVLFTWTFFSSVPSWRKILYHDDVTWSITTCISKLAKFVNWLQPSNLELYSIIICNSENLYTHVCMHSCKHTHMHTHSPGTSLGGQRRHFG